MLTSPHVLLVIVVRCLAVYLALLLGFRLVGKREIGQMTAFDLVLLLLISNAVQNAMTGPDTSLEGGLVAATTLLLADILIARGLLRHDRFRRTLLGSPTLLIHDGQMMADAMRREGITPDALQAALREHGVGSVRDVSSAVLELDGTISVLKPEDIHVSGDGNQRHRRVRFLRHP